MCPSGLAKDAMYPYQFLGAFFRWVTSDIWKGTMDSDITMQSHSHVFYGDNAWSIYALLPPTYRVSDLNDECGGGRHEKNLPSCTLTRTPMLRTSPEGGKKKKKQLSTGFTSDTASKLMMYCIPVIMHWSDVRGSYNTSGEWKNITASVLLLTRLLLVLVFKLIDTSV